MGLILRAGSSGFAYDEWRGVFYPADLPKDRMLPFYAAALPAVELNNTFYRMPAAKAVLQWRQRVPDAFRFAVKAPQQITWSRRLKDCGAVVGHLFGVLQQLGPTLGCVFYQVPKWVQMDRALLADFLAVHPAGARLAFEFAHPSWSAPEVGETLQGAGAAVVGSDRDEAPLAELPPGGSWSYLRLRRRDYSDDELRSRCVQLAAAGVTEAFVFFKHEDSGSGPTLARRLLALAAEPRGS